MIEQENKPAWQNEPDGKELEKMAAEVKHSYAIGASTENQVVVNVEEEWNKFCVKHPLVRHNSIGWQRWAIAASMLMLCTIGLAFGWKYLINTPAVLPSEADVVNIAIANDSIHEDSNRLTFRNTSLNTILDELAKRHGAKVRVKSVEDIYLYVELEKSWSLQECVDFLNHFERVNLKLTHDNIIVSE